MRRNSKIRSFTWLDWLKIIIAVDITANGIGLMFGIPFHIFANIFGWVSRVLFGLLYIFMAFLIFARTLYNRKVIIEKINTKDIRHFEDKKFLRRILSYFRKNLKRCFSTVEDVSDFILRKFDSILDYFESFFKKRGVELKEEVKTIIREDIEK